MLTLDDPTITPPDDRAAPGLVAAGTDGAWLLELFHTMRDRFDGPAPVRHDPDRLYHAHGDPRD